MTSRDVWVALLALSVCVVAGNVSAAAAGKVGNGHRKATATPTTRPTNTPTVAPTAIPTGTVSPTPTSTSVSSVSIKTVFVILMENHNWSQIAGASDAPYINSLISGANDAQTSYATQYYNPPNNHPSLPNYLWLEGGQCYAYCGTDNNPGTLITSAHLTTLLTNAGISWKAYEEGATDGVCPTANVGEYAVRHDPYMYFQDVAGNSSVCTAHVRSYSDLSTDLASNTVAQYNFITPNLCDDMHDSCMPTQDPVKQGDSWLSNQIPVIENSQAYQNGGAILITWDEAATGDGPIGMIVLSPRARGNGYHNSISYSHSSTLRTMEEIFHVSPLLGDAANATDLSGLFSSFP